MPFGEKSLDSADIEYFEGKFKKKAKHSRTISVDLDGVLNSYKTRVGLDKQWLLPDPPVPGALEWIQEMVKHFNVVVFTCRASFQEGKEAVEMWLKRWGFPDLPVTNEKPIATLYVDDRAMPFSGFFPSVQTVNNFAPWNRETWKDIPQWEGKYQASNQGRIRSADRTGSDGRKLKGKILKLQKWSNGYCKVTLSDGGRSTMRDFSVSRLIAETFLENPDNKPEVNHIDRNKDNNRLYNLEWATSAENSQHRYKTTPTDMNLNPKLTVEQVALIKYYLQMFGKKYGLVSTLMRIFNVTATTINSIRNGEAWSKVLPATEGPELLIPKCKRK